MAPFRREAVEWIIRLVDEYGEGDDQTEVRDQWRALSQAIVDANAILVELGDSDKLSDTVWTFLQCLLIDHLVNYSARK